MGRVATQYGNSPKQQREKYANNNIVNTPRSERNHHITFAPRIALTCREHAQYAINCRYAVVQLAQRDVGENTIKCVVFTCVVVQTHALRSGAAQLTGGRRTLKGPAVCPSGVC